jgi:hypothetical protein
MLALKEAVQQGKSKNSRMSLRKRSTPDLQINNEENPIMVGKKAVVFLSVLAFAGSVLAQGPRVAHSTAPSKVVAPAVAPPAGVKAIFTNLGPNLTSDAYNDTTGYYVLGPSNSVGDNEQWIAIPFTPAANSTAEYLIAAIGWETGTKAVILGLYSDNAGSPGTLLASAETTKIPEFGTCCTLLELKITATALTAGTQYWIGAQSDDTNAPDFTGVFESSNSGTTAYNPAQEGWFPFSNNVPAAAVYGTIQ